MGKMLSLRFIFACYVGLLFCSQDFGLSLHSLVLADDPIAYNIYTEQTLTWDEANDFCREKNLTMPFSLTLDELVRLRNQIRTKVATIPQCGYWMGGRADGTHWRWDFGTRPVDLNGWYGLEKNNFDKRKSDGAVPGCMALLYKESRFEPDGFVWFIKFCDEKKVVICQTYE